MIIIATFTGNPSLGYITDKRYLLKLSDTNTIVRLDGTGLCPYGSLEAFLNNWDEIEVY